LQSFEGDFLPLLTVNGFPYLRAFYDTDSATEKKAYGRLILGRERERFPAEEWWVVPK